MQFAYRYSFCTVLQLVPMQIYHSVSGLSSNVTRFLLVMYSPTYGCNRSKIHQRAIDTIQQNLEIEARLKMEAVVVRKKLEQDITELEITLEGVNKARAEAEKNLKHSQQEVGDLETLLEEEQRTKLASLLQYSQY